MQKLNGWTIGLYLVVTAVLAVFLFEGFKFFLLVKGAH